MLKLDFRNAFNSIHRDKMLKSVQEKAQVIYPLVHAAYSTPSFLFLGERIIQSADSLGPLLFCLAIHDVVSNLRSEFTAFYLDDGTLGGSLEDIKADLAYIEDAAKDINLFLNCSKSEIICVDDSICSSILSVTPSIQVIDPSDATLLGSPIGSTASIDAVLQSKINHLKFLGTRLKLLHTHDALCLLRNAFILPKVLYILRTSPCFKSDLLSVFHDVQRSLFEDICSIHLDDPGWLQESLPITSGGLGIRSVALFVPSAYLASAAGSSSTTLTILPTRLASSPELSHHQEALQLWSSNHSAPPPTGLEASKQSAWDAPRVKACFPSLLDLAIMASLQPVYLLPRGKSLVLG